jgi:hypothetical protein
MCVISQREQRDGPGDGMDEESIKFLVVHPTEMALLRIKTRCAANTTKKVGFEDCVVFFHHSSRSIE